jgi:DNA (cytosine-5)-methyltransferase 1
MNKRTRSRTSVKSVKKDTGILHKRASKDKLRVVSLFAGIGGFDRAFEEASADIVMQCEVDRFCRSVLRRHWPKAKVVEDIRKLDAGDIPSADVWTAGFPCQDVSLARGNHGRDGLKGSHTSLFFDLMRLVEAKRPNVLLLENVVGLLSSHDGCDFAVILTELISRGYAVSWRVMNARYFGVAQSRPRVFICAWKDNYLNAAAALFEPVISADKLPERHGFMAVSHHPSGAIVPNVSYCIAATSGRHTGNDWSRSYVSYSQKVRRPTPTESERLQGFPAGWSMPEKTISEPARGFDSDRYKAVGNAVAVPVVGWIAKRIKKISSSPSLRFNYDDLPEEVLRLAPELRKGTQILSFSKFAASIKDTTFKRKWKNGGVACRDMIIEGSTSSAPSKVVQSLFVDALDQEIPEDTYFLTANAAAGILRRVASVGRTLFPPMHDALKKMVQNVSESSIVDRESYWSNTVDESSIRSTRPVKRGGIRATGRNTARVELIAD